MVFCSFVGVVLVGFDGLGFLVSLELRADYALPPSASRCCDNEAPCMSE